MAAKSLGVSVFDLMARADKYWWKAMALACENAQVLAQQDAAKRQQKARKHGR